MALYVSVARRRRRLAAAVGAALVVGIVIGAIAGRSSAPTLEDRVASVQSDAEQTVAGLRVIALHEQDDTVGSQAGGGTDLVLDRTATELREEVRSAPWIDPAQLDDLLDQLDEIRASPDHTGDEFVAAVEDLAGQIEVTFGLPTG